MNKELLRTLKYGLIVSSAVLIQISTFALFNEVFRWNYWVSYLISLILSVIWNFTINRRFTFKSASNVTRAMLLVLAYYAVFTPISVWVEDFLTVHCGWNEYLVTCMNIAVNVVTEFLWQRFYVFRDSIDTNDLAQKETK